MNIYKSVVLMYVIGLLGLRTLQNYCFSKIFYSFVIVSKYSLNKFFSNKMYKHQDGNSLCSRQLPAISFKSLFVPKTLIFLVFPFYFFNKQTIITQISRHQHIIKLAD